MSVKLPSDAVLGVTAVPVLDAVTCPNVSTPRPTQNGGLSQPSMRAKT